MEAPLTRPNPSSSGGGVFPDPQQQAQEDTVQRLAKNLGTSSGNNGGGVNSAMNLKRLFSGVENQNDLVLELPSLDMQVLSSRMKKGGSSGSLLPSVGETSRLQNANLVLNQQNAVMSAPAVPKVMSASISPTNGVSTSTSSCNSANTPTPASDGDNFKDGTSSDEQALAVSSLAASSSWTQSTVAFAPAALVNNLQQSLKYLVDSRMKAWTVLLLRHSLSTGDENSRKRLLGILAASLQVESVSTEFQTLKLPESAHGQPKEFDVILPILFQAKVTVHGFIDPKTIMQNTNKHAHESVTLWAPGTICADFTPTSVKYVKIQLDCTALLTSMVEQARMLVLKAVAAATRTHVTSAPQPLSVPMEPSPTPSLMSTSKSLASFRSALNMNPITSEKSPTLQKAKSSALRLNSILQGTASQAASSSSESFNVKLGMRKTLSVRWNTPGEIPQLPHQQQDQLQMQHQQNQQQPMDDSDVDANPRAPKRARSINVAVNTARLKSFKSFGRPHAGDFGQGPRNATFGEFGGNAAGMWGRNGRMAAHPTPRVDNSLVDPISGEFRQAGQNAAFNLQQHINKPSYLMNKPSLHLAPGGVGGGGGGGTTASALPRTATVLESLLMKRSMN